MKFTREIAELRSEFHTELHTSIARIESRLAWQMTRIFVTMASVMVNIALQFLHH